MRIINAVLNLNGIFEQFEIEFLDSDDTTIHYLVGNNGAGKTHLIQHLHKAVVNATSANHIVGSVELSAKILDRQEVISAITEAKWLASNRSQPGLLTRPDNNNPVVVSTSNRSEVAQLEKRFRASVLSNVEINFTKSKISNITAEQPDTENPIETSQNLNTVIPQILVNIQQQDDAFIAQWMRQNSGEAVPEEFPDTKLSRFKSAYNNIFGSEKRFERVKPKDGEHKVIFVDKDEQEVEISDLSSGEKQIVFRLGFILKNLDTIDNGTVFIDEPEISLHPEWQLRFKRVLLEIFAGKNVQIFIATHSPYIFGDINPNIEECIRIDRHTNTAERVVFPQINQSSGYDNPSMNLVNYKAYGIPSTGLHIELYNAVQVACGSSQVANAESWLVSKGLQKTNYSVSGQTQYLNDDGSPSQYAAEETMPTWIRNTLNHPITDRREFNMNDLSASIELMLGVL